MFQLRRVFQQIGWVSYTRMFQLRRVFQQGVRANDYRLGLSWVHKNAVEFEKKVKRLVSGLGE